MDSPNNSEMGGKRKIAGQDLPIPMNFPSTEYHIDENGDNDLLTLSLSTSSHPIATALSPPPQLPFINSSPSGARPVRAPAPSPNRPAAAPPKRVRRNLTKAPKTATIPAAFPWSENCRATVRSLSYLRSQKITTISGDVLCKRCEHQYKMEFDLEKKFREVYEYIAVNKSRMHQRAPKIWMSPALSTCRFCSQEKSVKPVIAAKKRSINWLFLLLGQMLGCCTLDQLKYFCKHTGNHRTGAKDRVLFIAYMVLCMQLDPSGPFEVCTR